MVFRERFSSRAGIRTLSAPVQRIGGLAGDLGSKRGTATNAPLSIRHNAHNGNLSPTPAAQGITAALGHDLLATQQTHTLLELGQREVL